MPGGAFEGDPPAWPLWRPVRRYYLWKYRSEEPPLISVIVPEKTLDLNETATWLWEQLDGTSLLQNIADAFQEKFPQVPRFRLVLDLIQTLTAWHEERLIYLHWEHLR